MLRTFTKLPRHFGQGASVLGIVALSVLATLTVQHLLLPPPAIAQSDQLQEVRAARFVLVAADGTVLAKYRSPQLSERLLRTPGAGQRHATSQ